MSTNTRIPNRLKFSTVLSDRSKIEGSLPCSDEQWRAIWETLMNRNNAASQVGENKGDSND